MVLAAFVYYGRNNKINSVVEITFVEESQHFDFENHRSLAARPWNELDLKILRSMAQNLNIDLKKIYYWSRGWVLSVILSW